MAIDVRREMWRFSWRSFDSAVERADAGNVVIGKIEGWEAVFARQTVGMVRAEVADVRRRWR